MKFALSFFVVLMTAISALLFMQFQVYSDHIDTKEDTFYYSQEVEIVYRGESLDVRYHLKNLPNKDVKIVWPSKAENPACFIDAEYSCSRLNEDLTAFTAGETQAQSLSYVIPLRNGLKSNELLEDVFIKLKQGKVKFSTVHISTDKDIGGQWVTGLPQIGQQSLSLVNYVMFSGAGDVRDLYWRAGNLALQQTTDAVSIYAKKPTSAAFNDKLANIPFLNDQHIAIVEGENNAKAQGKRILFLPQITTAAIKEQVSYVQLNDLYEFEDMPRTFKDVMISYLTGSDFGSKRAVNMVQTLTAQMTDIQLKKWEDELHALQGKKVSPAVLDETLSSVFGIYTAYFSMNAKSTEPFPFLFNDKRTLTLNGEAQKDIDVIFKDGKVLYAAQPLLEKLQYTARIGERGYYVQGETRSFRFPNEKGFYIFNERRYNTISEPVERVAGQYYIEESWLQRLFLVEIKKSNEAIDLVTSNGQ